MHFLISMHFTRAQFDISRPRLFITGIARPLLIGLPSLLLVRDWWLSGAPAMGWLLWPLWAAGTLLLVWLMGLAPAERISLKTNVRAALGRIGLYAAGAAPAP
jgi:hypothetical protein